MPVIEFGCSVSGDEILSLVTHIGINTSLVGEDEKSSIDSRLMGRCRSSNSRSSIYQQQNKHHPSNE